jgi:PAP2 superfamily protein
MKRILVFGLLAFAIAFLGGNAASRPFAQGDVVRTWNDLALKTVRAKSASDAQAARLYAMVNVAMYDAVNGLATKGRRREAALVSPAHGADGDPSTAAAGAAHDVLVGLYPDQAGIYDAQLATDLSAAKSRGQAAHGREWGGRVADGVLAARANDGSSPPETQSPPAVLQPGDFPASWSGVQFRNLKPFAIADPDVYVSPGPPSLDSLDYAAAFAEVKLLGNAAIPDPAKSATFQFWSLGNGTDQPPGAWLQLAQTVSASRSLSLEDTARLFALESMAMADTVAPTYKTKFVYHSWRPTTAIRQADSDGNPNTTQDATWSARAGSVGSSPEHWSGHSSFSAAAATTLAGFFCSDHIPLTLVTDSSPGAQPRTYSSFSEAATEAGRSRVFGGLHFEFSNQAGLGAGRGIGAEVLSKKLLLKREPTHNGDCPL